MTGRAAADGQHKTAVEGEGGWQVRDREGHVSPLLGTMAHE